MTTVSIFSSFLFSHRLFSVHIINLTPNQGQSQKYCLSLTTDSDFSSSANSRENSSVFFFSVDFVSSSSTDSNLSFTFVQQTFFRFHRLRLLLVSASFSLSLLWVSHVLLSSMQVWQVCVWVTISVRLHHGRSFASSAKRWRLMACWLIT